MKKFFTIFVLVAMMSACTKDLSHNNNFVPYNTAGINDTTWLNQPATNPLNDSLQRIFNSPDSYTDSFSEITGKSLQFLGDDSLQLNFPAGCCINPADNSVIANGTIYFKISTLKLKGDFIRAMIPTSSNQTILKANKVFNLKLWWNGQDVNINPLLPITLNWLDKNADNTVGFYTGDPLSNPDLVFTFGAAPPTVGSVQVINYPSSSIVEGYHLTSSATNLFGLFNTYDANTDNTRLNVIMPLNFTNKNTVVFAVFKNSQTVIKLASDYSTRSFYTTGIPFNTVMTIVALSKIDNHFYWANKNIIFNSNNAVKVNPQEQSVADIDFALDGL